LIDKVWELSAVWFDGLLCSPDYAFVVYAVADGFYSFEVKRARSNRHIEPKADKTPMMLKTANFLIRFLNQTP
jgi:hypothetical protein